MYPYNLGHYNIQKIPTLPEELGRKLWKADVYNRFFHISGQSMCKERIIISLPYKQYIRQLI